MNLFRALSYKEWRKTRLQLLAAVLLLVAVILYSYIELTYEFRLRDAVNVWYALMFQDSSLALLMRYIFPLTGISLAIVQFVPEMVNKRFKLTLHLPATETRIVSAMLLYGYAALLVVFFSTSALMVGIMSTLLPNEIVWNMVLQQLPWMAAGLSGYGFASWICIEPTWKQRLANALIAVGLLALFFVSHLPGAYVHFGLELILLLLVSFIFPFYSCIRFKQGIQ